MVGTIVNTAAVVGGSLLGLLLNKKLPERYVQTVMQVMGLITVLIGISMALQANKLLLVVISLVLGALIGELVRLDERVAGLSSRIPDKWKGKNAQFSEGFITATLLFCTGSMTILGALEDGLGHTPNLLYTKSVMDGFSSIVLASGLGIGVLFSSVSVFAIQGSLTLLAYWIGSRMPEAFLSELTGVGGIILIGLAINLLAIKNIKVVNMLPALIILPVLYFLVY